MPQFDSYGRSITGDPGTAVAGAAPAAGLQPANLLIIKVPMTAAAGTTNDTQVTAPQKLRIIGAEMKTTSTVTSATVQVWTAAGGTGTAATSALAAAAAGCTRDALTTATQVFASQAVIYCYRAGGATLCGGELYLYCIPEQ